MGKFKPVFESLADAAIRGARHADLKLPQLTRNHSDQIDTFLRRTRGQDHFEAPSAQRPRPHTSMDGQVTDLPRADIGSDAGTFVDGEYRTVLTDEPITVYRVWGENTDGGAREVGKFTTTEQAVDRDDVAQRLALLPEWGNPRIHESTIEIPPGSTLNIGHAAPQTSADGTVFSGGAEQIIMPRGWDGSWVVSQRDVPEAK